MDAYGITLTDALVVAAFLGAPLILGRMCPMEKLSYLRRATQPPPVVFSLVWIVLYILYGVAFVALSKSSAPLSRAAAGLLCTAYALTLAYVYVMGCEQNMRASLAIVGLTVLVSTWLLFASAYVNIFITMMLVPSWCWLLYATLMQYQIVLDAEAIPN